MRTSIFIKSWKQDICWLGYCLRFLARNWRQPDTEVIVALDEDCRGLLKRADFDLDVHFEYVEPWPDGYSHAMFTKLCADHWALGDVIVLLDSDSLLLEPADLTHFLEGERLVVPFLFWSQHHEKFPHSPWFKVRNQMMGPMDVMHYMARMPIGYWPSTFAGLRAFICKRHKKERFADAVYSSTPFDPKTFEKHPISCNDYDALGAFGARYEPDRYVFRHLSQMRPNAFHQFHSWTEWNDDLRHRLEEQLHGSPVLPASSSA